MTKRLDEIFKQGEESLDRFYDVHGEWDGNSKRPIKKKTVRQCETCGKRIPIGEYCPTHRPKPKSEPAAKKIISKFINKILQKENENE